MNVRTRTLLAVACLLAACTSSNLAFAAAPEPIAVHAAPPATAAVASMPSQLLRFTLVAPLQLEQINQHYSHVLGTLDSLPLATLSVFSGAIECTPNAAITAHALHEFTGPTLSHGHDARLHITNGGDAKVLNATSFTGDIEHAHLYPPARLRLRSAVLAGMPRRDASEKATG